MSAHVLGWYPYDLTGDPMVLGYAGLVGTLAVVGLWAWLFPELRRVRRLGDLRPA